MRAGPGRERPGIEKPSIFFWIPFKKYRFWAPGRVGSGRGSENHRFSFKSLLKSIDFVPGQCRDGFGTVWGAQRRKNNRRKHSICAQLCFTAGHQMAGTIENLRKGANYLSAESHRVIGEFFGVNSPRTAPILEGPRGQKSDKKTRISATPAFGEIWRVLATTQTPVRTLPSRAHPQDDGSKTTPSKYEC